MKNLNKIIFIQILSLFLISLTGCDDDNSIFKAPDITISSYEILSDHTCLVKVRVNKGAGAKIKRLNIDFKDITDTTAQVFSVDCPVQDAIEYSDSFQIEIPARKHDYAVKANLSSVKNTYSGPSVIMRFSSDFNNFFTGINYIDLYKSEYKMVYIDNDIGNVVNRGEYFMIMIYYSVMPSSKGIYELKLNDSIPVKLETSFSGWMYNGETSWGAKIPANFTPGEYSVHLYANGTEYVAPSKLKVLTGSSVNISIPDCQVLYSSAGYMSYELNSSFLSGNKIYTFYRYPNHAVLAYDMVKKSWEIKKSISYPDGFNAYSHFELKNAEYNNKHYMTEYLYDDKNYKIIGINITEYDEVADTWKTITNYPGVCYDNFVQFVIGNSLYMGGGLKIGDGNLNHEFWEYNFIQNQWIKKKDIPDQVDNRILASCNSPSEGFIITGYRDFWKYMPDQDVWEQLPTLNLGPYARSATSLVYGNNKVYLVGGLPVDHLDPVLNDICEYDIAKKKWDFKYLLTTGIGATPAFFYKDKLIVGINRNWDSSPYFVEIKP